MKLPTLILALTMAFREGGLDLTPPVTGPIVNGPVVVRSCDRLVYARVKEIREYDFVGGKPNIRIAELDMMVVAQPFGSKWERLLVRLVDPGPPPELAYWPLARNRMLSDRDQREFPHLERYLKTEQLWMPTQSLNGPWPVREQGGTYEAQVPTAVLTNASVASPAGTPDAAAVQWISSHEVHRAVVAELERITPRTEARIVSTAPSNWSVEIDGKGVGSFSATTAFQWTGAQQAAWTAALSKYEFANMPSAVGSSRAPCSAVYVLSRVTGEGRRSVSYFGDGPRAGVVDPWVPRFEALWKVLEAQVPKE